jgi:hypothetical protein
MRKLLEIGLLLTCALVCSGFGACGRNVRPDPPQEVKCPVLPPVPASLMQPAQGAPTVQAELFEPPKQTPPRSAASKPSR